MTIHKVICHGFTEDSIDEETLKELEDNPNITEDYLQRLITQEDCDFTYIGEGYEGAGGFIISAENDAMEAASMHSKHTAPHQGVMREPGHTTEIIELREGLLWSILRRITGRDL